MGNYARIVVRNPPPLPPTNPLLVLTFLSTGTVKTPLATNSPSSLSTVLARLSPHPTAPLQPSMLYLTQIYLLVLAHASALLVLRGMLRVDCT